MRPAKLLVVLILAAVACGDDDDGGAADAAAGGPDGAVAMIDAPPAEVIPDPGTATNTEWTDVEPNDTPGQAVPQGVLTGPVWAGFVPPYTQIDDDTDVDFFVFETGDAASLPNVYVSICWSSPMTNVLDLYLYSVDAQQHQGPLVKMANSANTSCETLVEYGEGTTLLTAATTYLLEVRAAPGLALGGMPALYGA